LNKLLLDDIIQNNSKNVSVSYYFFNKNKQMLVSFELENWRSFRDKSIRTSYLHGQLGGVPKLQLAETFPMINTTEQ
jgi:SH3-like domain-containing protein